MQDFESKVKKCLDSGFFEKSDLKSVKTPEDFSQLIRQKVERNKFRCSNRNCEAHHRLIISNNSEQKCFLCGSEKEELTINFTF